MCNAWNHPPGCTCGWGGDGHLGGGGNWASQPESFHVAVSHFSIASSYTNPNARCPVCGESVFFYQSPCGGRVFFDELGPPWPKHPCTISELRSRTLEPVNRAAANPASVTHYTWFGAGWRPCTDVGVFRFPAEIAIIWGVSNDQYFRYYFYFSSFHEALFEPLKQPLMQLKVVDAATARISFCWPLGSSYEVTAYAKKEDVPVSSKP